MRSFRCLLAIAACIAVTSGLARAEGAATLWSGVAIGHSEENYGGTETTYVSYWHRSGDVAIERATQNCNEAGNWYCNPYGAVAGACFSTASGHRSYEQRRLETYGGGATLAEADREAMDNCRIHSLLDCRVNHNNLRRCAK